MYMNGVFVSAREDMPPMRLNDAVRALLCYTAGRIINVIYLRLVGALLIFFYKKRQLEMN